MVGLAPRALKDSVRPRRLSGVVVRPLNFTVRRPSEHFGSAISGNFAASASPGRSRFHGSGICRRGPPIGANAELGATHSCSSEPVHSCRDLRVLAVRTVAASQLA